MSLREPGTLPETRDIRGAFPRLDREQIAALEPHGEHRSIGEGGLVFREGEPLAEFCVVLSGKVAIVTGHGGPDERVFAVHGTGRFLGELSLLVGQAAFFSAVALEPTELLVLGADTVRELVAQDAQLGDLILRAYLARRELLLGFGGGLHIIGSSFSSETRRLREFAARNRVPHRWTDVESDLAAEHLLEQLGVSPEETPVVRWGEQVLRNPSPTDLARLIGLRHASGDDERIADLVIVGAGPAGLAASVYGASEGLDTIAVDRIATGGQAATSSRIENYLGFPAGISGGELAARAAIQAEKFGACLEVVAEVSSLDRDGSDYRLTFADGSRLLARTVLIATGARYRRLEVPRLEEFEGSSVMYAATIVEARLCAGDPVAVVGGGNSAGQAAVFLSEHTVQVRLIVRGDDLGADMSRYLVNQIERNPLIEVLLHHEVRKLGGEHGNLDELVVEDRRSGARTKIPARMLFVFIGARPHTRWLSDRVALDERGFVLTGRDAPSNGGLDPLLLETTLPGVFAAGDVRCGSIKRVASAVGEGSMAVRLVHEHLAHRRATQTQTNGAGSTSP